MPYPCIEISPSYKNHPQTRFAFIELDALDVIEGVIEKTRLVGIGSPHDLDKSLEEHFQAAVGSNFLCGAVYC